MRCQESEGSPTPWSVSPGTLRNNHNRQREIHARYQAEINPSACSFDGNYCYIRSQITAIDLEKAIPAFAG